MFSYSAVRKRYRFTISPIEILVGFLIFVLFVKYFLTASAIEKGEGHEGDDADSSAEQSPIFDEDSRLPQDDRIIKNYLLEKHLIPPSKKKYALEKPINLLKNFINLPVKEVLGEKQNGFFIECGAVDGEFYSNTIDLEMNSHWTGLLIEGSPALFQRLNKKHRKSWIANVCLTGDHPEKIEFLKHKAAFPNWRIGNGKINPGKKYDKPAKWGNEVFKMDDYVSEGMVECFPLYSLLSALNVRTVDFFSLDVEGHEYKILKFIPFEKLDIKVLLIEYWMAPEGKDAIKSLMLSKGYKLYFQNDSDFIFVQHDYVIPKE